MVILGMFLKMSLCVHTVALHAYCMSICSCLGVGTERKAICSWPHFLKYWDNNFPFIKMRKRGADTCTECLQATYKLCKVGIGNNAITGGNGDEGEEDPLVPMEEEEADGDDNVNLVSAIHDAEQKLAAARMHVAQYQSQRKLVNQVISVAKSDAKNLPIQLRRKVITIDMGQNLGLPNFEG